MENLILIKTKEQLEQLISTVDALDRDEVFPAFDTETTGVEKDSEIVGYSLAWSADTAYYIVLAEWQLKEARIDCATCSGTGGIDVEGAQVECQDCAGSGKAWGKTGELVRNKDLIEGTEYLLALLTTFRLVMHNSPFDCERVQWQFQIDLMPSVHTDTMELAHVLDENNSCGLKDIGYREFGESSTQEQKLMKESVIERGGIWSDARGGTKEMFKAHPDLLGRYGAKDTILTWKVFFLYVERLIDEQLDSFFYDHESMPLMRGPTYELNTTGLRVDLDKLKQLERDLTEECGRLKVEIVDATRKYVMDRFPGTKKTNTFNIGSSAQLGWLLFIKLGNEFKILTDGGRSIAKELCGRIPYNASAKRQFIAAIQERKSSAERRLAELEAKLKAELEALPKKGSKEQKDALRATYKPRIALTKKEITRYTPEKYIKCDKDTLTSLAKKYEWVAKLLRYRAAGKLLSTYVLGIQARQRYGTIYPSFLQAGTTSGRYSSKNPNFQNLPRDDKRVKACIISRPGKVFVGADYSQLEPRVFASVSQDEALMGCFAKGEDFYSVVGIPVWKKYECSTYKKEENSLDKLFPHVRQNAKTLALATPYGTTANQQASKIRDEEGNTVSVQEAQGYIDAYFQAYPKVKKMMLDSHEIAMRDGVVYNLYGRPRRIPDAKRIRKIYGAKAHHGNLPYEARTLLNLAMNHRVQSSGASIVNRAAIAFHARMQELQLDAKIVLQVHDEIVVECRKEDAEVVKAELKYAMEKTTELPGVELVAEPKVAECLADLK